MNSVSDTAHPQGNIEGAVVAVHMSAHDGSRRTLWAFAPRPCSREQQPPRQLCAPGGGAKLLAQRPQQGGRVKPALRRDRFQQLAVARREQDGGLRILNDVCPALHVKYGEILPARAGYCPMRTRECRVTINWVSMQQACAIPLVAAYHDGAIQVWQCPTDLSQYLYGKRTAWCGQQLQQLRAATSTTCGQPISEDLQAILPSAN
jgi:hypothetical protein